MRKLFALCLVVAVLAISGCTASTQEPGANPLGSLGSQTESETACLSQVNSKLDDLKNIGFAASLVSIRSFTSRDSGLSYAQDSASLDKYANAASCDIKELELASQNEMIIVKVSFGQESAPLVCNGAELMKKSMQLVDSNFTKYPTVACRPATPV